MGAVLALGPDVNRQLAAWLLVNEEDAASGEVATAIGDLMSSRANGSRRRWRPGELSTASHSTRAAVLCALCAAAAHPIPSVRASALVALGEAELRGDQCVQPTLIASTRDEDALVRGTAVVVLADTATHADHGVGEALARCLEDREVEVVHAALEAASRFRAPDDGKLSAAVVERLRAESWLTRKKAVNALAEVAEVGDNAAVGALISQALADANRWVRVAALDALARLAPRGDGRALASVAARLSDDVGRVRVAALAATARIAEARGDRGTIAAIAPHLEDVYPSVRCAALEALAAVARPGSREELALVAARLHDADPTVRAEAVEALLTVAETGDADARERLEELLRKECDEDVCAAAESALDRL